ncbi:MAG: hypothetical protein LBK65_05140 [Tannerellaceae bacterium]|jgi:hypothetical protein|nr:hypothetical protein [Tannerellaceae bacterium]
MKRILFFALLGCISSGSCRDVAFEASVRTAVDRQMQTYPLSTLKDLYKNFFQDKFGPGHIIADTAGAGQYLRAELDSYTVIEGEAAEPTGREGNFYRVNLSVIKTGQVPYEVYFDAFIRSVQGINPPPVAEWAEEWTRIEAVIRSMGLSLPDYETDREEIEKRLSDGEYTGHHSSRFEAGYSPHYRIISKEIYEREIAPLI